MHRRPVRDDLSDVSDAMGWADAIAAEAGLGERVRHDLQVCLEEALSNLVIHAHAAGEKDIALELLADGGNALVQISDRCAPFDVATAPLPRPDAARTGGAGLRLLRTFAGALHYAREDDRNVLRLTVHAPAVIDTATFKNIPAFAEMPDAALRQLIDASATHVFETAARLMTQGETSEFCIILLEGSVSIVNERQSGAFPVANVHAPALIGEIGALADLPRTASAVALTPVTAITASSAALRRAFDNAPRSLHGVIRQLGQQIRNVNTALGLYADGLGALERGEIDQTLAHDLDHLGPNLENFTEAFRRLTKRIEQERRTRAEMASAAVIQREMLPREMGDERLAGRCDVFGDMTPAKHVGGDLYDVFMLDDDRLALCVGDVCGKGVPASLFMCITVTTLRIVAREGLALDDMMAKVNTSLFAQNPTSIFATLFFGVVDLRNGRLTYVNCGHNPPLVLHRDGACTPLASSGPPLAILPAKRWPVQEATLAPGEALFIFSDGVTEALDVGGVEYGEERLLHVLSGAPVRDAKGLVAAVNQNVARFAEGAEQADDITCLALVLPTK